MSIRNTPGSDYQRRVGRIDEWRAVLTPRQIALINPLNPDRLWDIFGRES